MSSREVESPISISRRTLDPCRSTSSPVAFVSFSRERVSLIACIAMEPLDTVDEEDVSKFVDETDRLRFGFELAFADSLEGSA